MVVESYIYRFTGYVKKGLYDPPVEFSVMAADLDAACAEAARVLKVDGSAAFNVTEIQPVLF